VGINESAVAALGYSIYPNPISQNSTISYYIPEKADVKFELYNPIGELIHTINKSVQEVGHYEFDFDVKQLNLKAGVYFMKLTTPYKSASIRLIKLD
ncbi:MAG: T9SS type A sorting domain-containing protein, partial [Bacteroidia bacterium]